MPYIGHQVTLMRAILPLAAFDYLMGNILGVSQSMDHFVGRKLSIEPIK